MERLNASATSEVATGEWVALPGGELEGKRPTRLCGPCQMRKAIGAERKAVCFECYKAEARRQQAFQNAASLETHSDARLQFGLPFEAVDRPRLERLKAARAESRRQLRAGTGQYVDRRRQAQIAARRALQQLGTGLQSYGWRAAELQLPDAWLPFVSARR
jgi:hypothetical protein